MRAEGGQMMGSHPAIDRLRDIVTPIVDDLGLDLYDLEQRGGTFRVTVDTRPGSERGIDLDELALVTRSISRELDHVDPIPGRYTLEVSSPGLERPLRTRLHYERAIGETVKIKTFADVDGNRRFSGTLVGSTEAGFMLEIDGDTRAFAYDDVAKARTVFEWGGAPKPGQGDKRPSIPESQREAH